MLTTQILKGAFLFALVAVASSQGLPPPKRTDISGCNPGESSYTYDNSKQAWLCISCATGFYQFNAGLECRACTSPCSSCTTASVCTGCRSEYYLSSGTCQSCIKGCGSCSNGSICSECKLGFFGNSNTLITSCTACGIANCARCTTTSDCQSCMAFYSLETKNGTPTCTNAVGNFFLIVAIIIGVICAIVISIWVCCICCCVQVVQAHNDVVLDSNRNTFEIQANPYGQQTVYTYS